MASWHTSDSPSLPPDTTSDTAPGSTSGAGIGWPELSQALALRHSSPSGASKLSADSLKRSVRAWTGQIVDLTRRAEAAEARVRELEAELAAERASLSSLGRRFGKLPHESYPAFVVRLGMMAKARPLARERTQRDASTTGADTV